MRRALVLTNETARHPFRASLPPHVTAGVNEIERRVPWRLTLGLTKDDLRSVASTYCAGFLAVSLFIA